MSESTRAKKRHSDLDYVLLCLIHLHPNISGYQLRSIINDSTGYFFHAHLSQIYPALKRLTEAKLTEFDEVKRDGKPDLKLYSITPAGEEAVHEWLTAPYDFQPTRASADRYFLKLILTGHLAPEELEAFIDSGIKEFTSQRKNIAEGNLKREREFISQLPARTQKRYLTLWENEFAFLIKEFDERIAWLMKLKEELD